jgi:peptidyl-prolyl cis-trans isomerase D
MKTVMLIVGVSFLVGFVFLSDGLQPGRGRSNENIVGMVNGQAIGYEEYRFAVNQLADVERRRVEREELSTLDYERLEDQVWERLVNERLVRQEADRLGLHATDEEIVAQLTNDPPPAVRQLFVDEQGQFDIATYQRALNDPSFPWLQYEHLVRRDLPLLKLTQMVYSRASASEAEVREEYARRELKNTVRYVGKLWSDVDLGDFEPAEADLRRFYDEHIDVYETGEQVVLEALRIEKSPSPEDRAELMGEARAMLGELEEGQVSDFGALAEIYSEDPSQTRGGDMGWTQRGFLPGPVEEATWRLDPGQRTEPIESERGLYIVQVDSVRTDDAGERMLYLRQLFLRSTPSTDTLDSLRVLAFEVAEAAKKDFEAAAAQYGISIERLQPARRSGLIPGFGYSQRVREWAFDAAPGSVGGPYANDDVSFVFRVAEKMEAAPLPFDEVESRVKSAFIQERKKVVARETLVAVHEALRAGATLAEAATMQGLQVEEPEPFTHYESVPGVGSANEFTALGYVLVPGQTSGVIETNLGAYIMELVARDEFDEEKYREARDSHYQSMIGRRATQIYEASLQELNDRAEIIDNRRPRV